MSGPTVILADDHALVRSGLRSLIEAADRWSVVAEAGDGEQAIALVARHHPDILVLDITMPRLDGLAALPRIKRACASTRVLMLSMYDSADVVMHALREGAHGYLLKDSIADELVFALRSIHDGRAYVSPAIAGLVVDAALSPSGGRDDAGSSMRVDQVLTPRQVDILRRLARGSSMKEIAFDLSISVKTVETHRAQIMDRLAIRNIPQLVLFAVRHGLVSPRGH
jgi:DNA-binding NarL/FixJ family response regulator